MIRKSFLLLLITCLIIGTQLINASAQVDKETAVLSGRVTDVDGDPLPDISVVVIDWYRQRVLRILKTDSAGQYEIEVEAGSPYSYRIYAYKEAGDFIIYAPSTFEETFFPEPGENRVLRDLKLVPGAKLNVTGEVWNVFTAKYSTSLKVEVIDPESGRTLNYMVDPSVGDYTPFYGDNITSYFVNPNWISPPLSSGYWAIVIIPANRPVELRVRASQPGIGDQVFTVRDGEAPFILPQGAFKSVDVTQAAYMWSLSKVEEASRQMWASIYDAERFGFFLIALKNDAMNEVDNRIADSRQKIERGAISIELQENIRRAYIYATRYIVNELLNMRDIAEKGALFLPIFLTVFSIMITLFISEKSKLAKRIPLFILLFIVMTVCFYYLYPGIPLILTRFSNLFYISVSIAFISGLLLISLFQKIIHEASSPTKVPLRSALSVAFTLGKRYVKLRKFSSTLIIISICMLISTATTLTSVTSVFGLDNEVVGSSSKEWAFMKNPGDVEGSFIPIDVITMLHIKNETNVKLVSPKMESLPEIYRYSMQLMSADKRVQVLGVIGVDPELDRKYVDLQLIGGEYVSDNGSIMISYSVAQKLGVKLGDTITFKFASGGSVFEIPMKVAGVFSDDDFNNKKDLNGEPYAPSVIVGNKLARCNASQVVIMNLQKTLELSSKTYSLPISISRMIVEFEDPSRGVDDFVRTQAWARGFHIWLSHNGKLTHYFLGTMIEIRFLDIFPPLVIVMMFIMRIMYDVVDRRRKEIFIYTTLGFNPMHISLVFIAESATMGLLGGGIGYLLGLSFFRIIRYISESAQVGISENLHWEASIISILVGLAIAVASAIPPAMKAARLAVPSLTRKVKLSPEEEKRRYEEIYKAFGERVFFIPVRVGRNEVEFLTGYLYDKLKDRTGGFSERIEDLGQVEEVKEPDGSEAFLLGFRYVVVHKEKTLSTSNKIRLECKPGENSFRMYLHSTAEQEGMPELIRERLMKIIYDISVDWLKRRPSPYKSPPRL